MIQKNIFLSILLLVIFSCSKDKTEPPIPTEPPFPIYEAGDTSTGSIKGKKNGWDWNASAFSREFIFELDTFYAIDLRTYTDFGAKREDLTLGFLVPWEVGSFSFTTEYHPVHLSSYATLADDGDVLEDFYELNESFQDNSINITKFDAIEGVIEGDFTAHFKIKDPEEKRNELNPDNISFTEMTFSVKID